MQHGGPPETLESADPDSPLSVYCGAIVDVSGKSRRSEAAAFNRLPKHSRRECQTLANLGRLSGRVVQGMMLLIASVPVLCTAALALPQNSSLPDEARSQIENRLYQRGMADLRGRQYDEALSIFRSLEREVPQSPLGFTGEGIGLALLNRQPEAISSLKKAIGIDPHCWIARRELGMIEWELGQKEKAAAQLMPVAQAVPDDATVSAILGQYWFGKEQYSQAVRLFAAAPAQVGASPRLVLMNAEALIRTGHAAEAIRQLSGISAYPDLSPQERFRVAWLLGEAGDYSAAIPAFRGLPENFPERFARDYGLALAYYEEGQYDACFHLLKSLSGAEAQHPEIFSLLGAAEDAAGHPEAAWSVFRDGIAAFPQEPDNYLNAATVAVQIHEYRRALQVLVAGLQRISGDYRLWQTRGVVYTLAGNTAKAESDYRTAVRLAPKEASPWVALGICYMDQNRNQQAAQIFRQAIALEIHDVRLNYYLVDVLLKDGMTPDSPSWREAMDISNASIRLNPLFPYSFYQRSKLWRIKGDRGRSIADLETAHRLDPESSSITYQLALAQRNAGNRKEAAALLSQVTHAVAEEDDEYRHTALMSVIESTPKGFMP